MRQGLISRLNRLRFHLSPYALAARLWGYFQTYPGLIWLWLSGLVLIGVGGLNDTSLMLPLWEVLGLGIVALAFGSLVARAEIWPWLAAVSVASFGLEYVVVMWGGLWPTLVEILQSLSGGIWPGSNLGWADVPGRLQAFQVALNDVLRRWQIWLMGFPEPSQADAIALQLTWGILLWLAIAFLGWATWRHHQAMLAILPLGALLSVGVFFAQGPYTYLAGFMFFTLLLQVSLYFFRQRQRWDQRHIDYAHHLGQEVHLAGVVIALVVIALAFITPTLSYKAFTREFYRLFDIEAREVNDFAQSFGFNAGVGEMVGTNDGGLPRSHLLGNTRDLTEHVVMRITTDDPPPIDLPEFLSQDVNQLVPRYYWYGANYNRYTREGWATSPLRSTELNPDEPLSEGAGPGRLVTMDVSLTRRANALLYSAGLPLRVNLPVTARYRGRSEYMLATVPSSRYQVMAWVQEPGIAELRAASTDYDPALRQDYLVLPATVPDRVRDLAEAITADQPTAYDKAAALEAYLRQFRYDLTVPPPPGDVDVADYFLFELQAGYCDYYATAMAVMARSVGLPARFVVGYATGNYDADRNTYIVTEAEAHSWVQIYFPEIGWVNFEPTAGRAAINRPNIVDAGDQAASPPVPPQFDTESGTTGGNPSLLARLPHISPVWYAMVLLVLGGWAWWRIDRWRLERLSVEALLPVLYTRLLKQSARIGYAPPIGSTPYEFGFGLTRYLERNLAAGTTAQLFPVDLTALHDLVAIFVRHTYAAPSYRRESAWQILQRWRALQPKLRRASLIILGQQHYARLFSRATPPNNPASSPSVTGTMGQSSQ